jgi:hypothetical protein
VPLDQLDEVSALGSVEALELALQPRHRDQGVAMR